MKFACKVFALFLLLSLPFILFILPITSGPAVTTIPALAPVEVVAGGFREPVGVAVDENGTIFVSDRKAGEVFKIGASEVHPVVTGLRRPVGLAFDSQGRLLIAEEKEGRLLSGEAIGFCRWFQRATGDCDS